MMDLEKYDYKGCNPCPLNNGAEKTTCKEHRVNLKVRVTKPISWEDWNRFIPVFKVGDVVDVEGVAKDGILYCCGGESTLHSGVKDYIDLGSIEVVEVIA